VIGECDEGSGDPQRLARLSLRGYGGVITPDDAAYVAARQCYLQRLPDAEQRFGFADFMLFRFAIESARFVGGFGQAHSYRGEEIRSMLLQTK
jgi:putative heme iron utilization protein